MLSEVLLYRREKLNISIVKLSEMSGVPVDEYALLENPISSKMSKTTFEKLAPILGLSEAFEKEYVSPYTSLSAALRMKRLEKNLTIAQLSKLSGVRRTYLWNLENEDRQRLSVVLFKKLEKALEIEDGDNFEPFLAKSSATKIKFMNDGYFGKLMLQKRLGMLLSQREVAVKANIDFTLISKLEVGARTTLTTKNAIKIMNALNFTEEEKGRYLIKK